MAVTAFEYPSQPHQRRHGPRGYRRSTSFKPWLRDEFMFRCVYCLCRERWLPDGDDHFSVDHFIPQSLSPDRRGDYENMLYACCQCNAGKQDCALLPDPCEESLATHLHVSDDGEIHGLTPEGLAFIKVCRLDRPKLTAFRRGMIAILGKLSKHENYDGALLIRNCMGFPDNLPRLETLRPPGGNARPGGVATSASELRNRGELPEIY